jgi:hypothetical protein
MFVVRQTTPEIDCDVSASLVPEIPMDQRYRRRSIGGRTLGKGLPPESNSGASRAYSRKRAHALVRKYSAPSSNSIKQQQAMRRYPFRRAMNGYARLNHGSSLLPFPFGICSAFARTKPEVGQLVARKLIVKCRRSIQMGSLERREDLRVRQQVVSVCRRIKRNPNRPRSGTVVQCVQSSCERSRLRELKHHRSR